LCATPGDSSSFLDILLNFDHCLPNEALTTMDSSTRPTLLESLRDGADPYSWEEFFRRYWPLIYGYAKHEGCSEHTAEDIVQDVMTTVFQQRCVFRYDPQRGRFRSWLGMVVRNKIAEYRRRPAQRARARGGDEETGSSLPATTDDSPGAVWEAAFERNLLVALLDVLQQEMDPQRFQAFELSVYSDLRAAEVAKITGLTRHGVYNARRTALKRLQELGQPYCQRGELTARIKEVIESLPDASVERTLTSRMKKSIRVKVKL
jgi:RNA polymerase sigma factor (sigma-70 family)